MKEIGTLSLLVLILAISSMTLVAWADEGSLKEDMALAKAKITLNQAINNALAVVPGKAVSAELDDEESTVVYLVEVVSHGQTYEVTLDTQNGKVLKKQLNSEDENNDHDGDNDHDKEDKD